MSRIDDLIDTLCPDGVPHRALGDVGEFIRGNGLQKGDLTDSGVPAIHYGQIHTHYGVKTAVTTSFTTTEVAVKLRFASPGDLLIATTSEDNEAVAKATAWVGERSVVLSGDAYIYRHQLDPSTSPTSSRPSSSMLRSAPTFRARRFAGSREPLSRRFVSQSPR